MSITNIFRNDDNIHKQIYEMLEYLNQCINEINVLVVKRQTKIDFYDLFFYIMIYNSSDSCTHSENLINFNINTELDLSKNTIINRLITLNPEHLKNINNKMIDYFYKLFNIDRKNIICASDGSKIKLLSSLKYHFKEDNNELYTTRNINSVYDVDNKIPIYFDIFKSSNEIENFTSQIINDTNNMTYVTDRGYTDKKLINFYLSKNMFFISRITKNNNFSNKLITNNNIINNDNKFEETQFKYDFKEKQYDLKIIKY